MRILMLGWELPPHNSGGLGVACFQLCKALARLGADIDFILPYTAEHRVDFMNVTSAHPQDVAAVVRAGLAYDSYKYIYTDGHEEWLNIFDQHQLYEHGVAGFLKREPKLYDVVHAHDWLTFRAGIRAKMLLGCPLIVHVHSVERDRAGGTPGNPLVREIEGMAFLLADRIIAVSQHTKDMIAEDYHIPPDKIEVIHNSVDARGLEPLEAENTYKYLAAMKAQGYRVVANVGRLTVQKGLTHLLQAAKEVISRAPKTFFLIVGSGEQYFELIQEAADLGIGQQVLFVDFQRGKRLRDAYAIADLFVMPSISEPFGLTALEAVGYGTPVLMSRQSGVSEVLRHSLKVDFWDVSEMANKIVGVVQNDALRDELLKNAAREFESLSWDTPANKLLNVYGKHLQRAAA